MMGVEDGSGLPVHPATDFSLLQQSSSPSKAAMEGLFRED